MRLLSRADGILSITLDHPPTGAYAILSHTWGPADEEVTLDDINNHVYRQKLGYRKVDFCLEQAQKGGYKYVWVDTCCIDKRDRNELGEAINRMFEWYAEAAVCYVYLQDIVHRPISRSRWFTRGWTLQELIAPRDVRFYSSDGSCLGDKFSLRQEILTATGIDTAMSLADVPLLERFRWSLKRNTTKPEDASYCLLGILEVKLLFNYGEGAESAQERLFAEVQAEHGLRTSRGIRSAAVAHSHISDEAWTPESLLASLAFKEIGSRCANIRRPFKGTCRWILSHETYWPWSKMQSKERLLWIKGKPGTGKSTLMRLLDQETSREAVQVRMSFYFNARGEVLERTTLGMYRALLRQFLLRAPEIQALLVEHIKDEAINCQPWTVQSVQRALRFCVHRILGAVQCFVDALDECEVSEVQEMVDFFEDLSQAEPHLFVCFASRYYPTISVRHSIELLLDNEGQHVQDLQDYVKGKLNVSRDAYGDGLKRRVVAKAQGIFFWAVLVVDMLNREISAGSMYNVPKRLDELPSQLSGLLQEIMSRDTVELDRFRFSLQWILFAPRPLKVKEYYFAMVTSLSEAGLVPKTAYTEAWDSASTTFDQMRRYVSSSSRGLAEAVKSEMKGDEDSVQLIHESVRDFLLQHNGLQTLFTHVSGDVIGSVHEELSRTCQKYITVVFTSQAGTISNDRPNNLSEWRMEWFTRYPFFAYAMDHVIYHADQAAISRVQHSFVRQFDIAWFVKVCYQTSLYSIRWIQELNIPQPGLIHILAYYDAARLICNARELGFEINSPGSSSSPLQVAAYVGSKKAARMLLSKGADVDAVSEDGVRALLLAIERKDSEMSQILLEHGADATRKSCETVSPLCRAVELESAKCVQLLLSYGARAEVRDSIGNTAFIVVLRDPDTLGIFMRYNADVVATNRRLERGLLFLMKGIRGKGGPGCEREAATQAPLTS